MGDNHRQQPRIETDALVDVTATDVLLYHHIENLSLGGLCIQSPIVEPVGTRVSLSINFPDLHRTLDVEGEVVWANADHPCDMGIKFVNLKDGDKELLKQYLELRRRTRETTR
jgi:uncharacterized protein (TIGR02266 family)